MLVGHTTIDLWKYYVEILEDTNPDNSTPGINFHPQGLIHSTLQTAFYYIISDDTESQPF